MAIINQSNILNLQPGITAPVVVHMSEGDVGTKLSFKLIDGANAWTDPGNVVAAVHGRRQDGTQFGPYACTISGDVVSFQTDAAMAGAAGSGIAQIVLTDSNSATAGSANFAVMIERATFPMGVTYTNDVSVYEAILAYAQTIPAQVVDDYTAKIEAEATARTAADAELAAEDVRIQDQLAAEANTRAQQDSVLSARMDSFARLPDGSLSTAADAEMADVRVMTDGTEAPTAGDAVREQVSILKDELTAFTVDATKLVLTTFDRNGVALTKNTDGTYTLSGTAEVGFNTPIGTFTPKAGTTYIFESNMEPAPTDTNWYLYVKGVDGTGTWYRTGEIFTCTTDSVLTVSVLGEVNTSVDVTLRPYITEYPILSAKYLDAKIDKEAGVPKSILAYQGDYSSEIPIQKLGYVWENYDVNASTGIIKNLTRLTTANKIDTRGYSRVKISAPSGYNFRIFVYNDEEGASAAFSYDWVTNGGQMSYDLMFPYIRILLSKTSGTIAPEEAEGYTIEFADELTEYSQKEMSLMMDANINAEIIKHTYGLIASSATDRAAYEPYRSASQTFETADTWISAIYRCVAGDSIEVISRQEASRYIFATYGTNGTLVYYENGAGLNYSKKVTHTFTAEEKYFRVTCRRTSYQFAYVKYHSHFNNSRVVPDYAQAECERVLEELQNKMLLGNPIVFGFNTDQHCSAKYEYANSVVWGLRTMKMLSEAIPFDFQCLGGDAPSYDSTEVVDILNDVNYVTKQLLNCGCPVIPIVGNHDAIDNNPNVTNAEIYNVTFKRAVNDKLFDYYALNACNAYIDSAQHAVRYIFVDSIPRTGYTLEDVNAFLGNALSTLPTGYNAVVISHRALNPDLPTGFGDTVDCKEVLEQYASKIIMCISGHTHSDNSATLSGILYVSTTTSGRDALVSGDTRIDATGTADETAYDVFVIDQVNLKVYAVRYGYGDNREWSYTL